jgi:hypothetical protein
MKKKIISLKIKIRNIVMMKMIMFKMVVMEKKE